MDMKNNKFKMATLPTLFLMFGLSLAVNTGRAMACDLPDNERISELEKQVSELKALLHRGSVPVNPPSRTPVACSSIDLRTAKLHVKCTTSKGFVYERVSRDNFGEAWKGPDGLIWSDRFGGAGDIYSDDPQHLVSPYEAMTICKDMGGRLPSRKDFESGIASGFQEVLPNMTDYLFWARPEDYQAFLWYLNPRGGFRSGPAEVPTMETTDNAFLTMSVRCVAK